MRNRAIVITRLISLSCRSAMTANTPRNIEWPLRGRTKVASRPTPVRRPSPKRSVSRIKVFANWSAIKRPLATSHNRPLAVVRPRSRADIRTSVPLSFQTLPCRNVPSCFGGPIGDAQRDHRRFEHWHWRCSRLRHLLTANSQYRTVFPDNNQSSCASRNKTSTRARILDGAACWDG